MNKCYLDRLACEKAEWAKEREERMQEDERFMRRVRWAFYFWALMGVASMFLHAFGL
jgi:hypothetical protein